MLYVDAIRVLEKVARARFDLASMPKKEEIEEAIPIVAGMVTVQACPKYALHAALWWLAVKSKEVEYKERLVPESHSRRTAPARETQAGI